MSDPLILKSAQVGPWPMNSYAIICPETNRSVLVDPGADPDTLRTLLGKSTPLAIFLTHAHADHVGALAAMKEQLNVPVYMHPADSPLCVSADVWFAGGSTFTLGRHTLDIVHTPGHTLGMVTIMLPDNRAVVGDTIFKGGPGKTWSPQYFAVTMNTLQNIVFQWPDDMLCYPGHGPSFRLGDERPAFEAFLSRRHPDDLYGDITWEM
jgi:hydroxyacylglutathione hydrolase